VTPEENELDQWLREATAFVEHISRLVEQQLGSEGATEQ
jgi:hypothetical protein